VAKSPKSISMLGYEYVKIDGKWVESKTKTPIETTYGIAASKAMVEQLDLLLANLQKEVGQAPTNNKPQENLENIVPKTKKEPKTKNPRMDRDISDLLSTGDDLYDYLLNLVNKGEIMENGRMSDRLQIAKTFKDVGIPITKDLMREISKKVEYANRSGDFHGVLGTYISGTIDAFKKPAYVFDDSAIREWAQKNPPKFVDKTEKYDPHKLPPPDNRTHWEKLADQYKHESQEIYGDIEDIIGNVSSLFTGKKYKSKKQTQADSPFRRRYKSHLKSKYPILSMLTGRFEGVSKNITNSGIIHPLGHKPDAGEVLQMMGSHEDPDHLSQKNPENIVNKNTPQAEPVSQEKETDEKLVGVMKLIENNTKAALSLLARVISPNSAIAKMVFPGIAGGDYKPSNDPFSIFGRMFSDFTGKKFNNKDTNENKEEAKPSKVVHNADNLDNEEDKETSRFKSEEQEASGEKITKVEVTNAKEIAVDITNEDAKKERKMYDLTDADKERLEHFGYKRQGFAYRNPKGKMATKEEIFETVDSPRRMSELTEDEIEILSGKGYKRKGFAYTHPDGGMASKEQLFEALKGEAEPSIGADATTEAMEGEEVASLFGPEAVLAFLALKQAWKIGGPIVKGALGIAGSLGRGALGITRGTLGGGTNSYFGYGSNIAKKSKFAKGGVVDNMSIDAFADGGVVDSPMFFDHSGGKGVMGEAGPEAIIPLKRGSDGKLGVSAGELTKPKIPNDSLELRKVADDISKKSSQQQIQSNPIVINDNKTINNGSGGGFVGMAGSTAGPRNSLDLLYFV
jgi:hypothetical protein